MPYIGIASNDLEDMAIAKKIITLIAANFEHMWFISWPEAVPASGTPFDSCPYIRPCKQVRHQTHSGLRGPVSEGLTRWDATANQPNLSLAPNHLSQIGFSF